MLMDRDFIWAAEHTYSVQMIFYRVGTWNLYNLLNSVTPINAMTRKTSIYWFTCMHIVYCMCVCVCVFNILWSTHHWTFLSPTSTQIHLPLGCNKSVTMIRPTSMIYIGTYNTNPKLLVHFIVAYFLRVRI